MKTWKAVLEKYEKPILIGVGAFLLSAFLMNVEFNFVESALYDFRMRMGAQPKPSDDIALIAIDDESANRLDEFSPLPLQTHVELLEKVEKLGPKAIGYLVDLNKVSQVYPEQMKSDLPARFVGVASRMEITGTPFILGTPFDVTGEVIPPYPLSAVAHSVAVIHKDGNVFGEDKITRRALLQLYGKPAFHLEMAERLGLIGNSEHIRGEFSDTVADATYFFFRYHGSTGFGPGVLRKTNYPVYSMIDVLEGKVGASALKDKIILVGTMSKNDSADFAFTPYSKRAFMNPKLVVHANILDSIIHQNGVLRAPTWMNWITTFLVSMFVIWSVFTYTPLYGVFNTITLALGFLLVGQVLFSIRGLWIREAQPLIGIFLAYYLAVPYRLIQEYKRRWDYQQKTELLMQVEEMKTNFLRLVTHDLKTPVARIQGLAEMVLRKTQARLDSSEKENLQHIMNSTEELNHFISSVLELTKVESNRVTLELASKDVNQLVENVVARLKTHCTTRSVKVDLDLEPLFPIRLDSNLIEKVLTNLIDNAVKYSPEGSKVLVRTRDVGTHVEVSVIDQGIGLTRDEVGHLFTRFYRAKNDETMRIKGTGLGLYLTKYFVEAHQGRVEVESVKGKGSTFKILLPVDLKVTNNNPGLRVEKVSPKADEQVS